MPRRLVWADEYAIQASCLSRVCRLQCYRINGGAFFLSEEQSASEFGAMFIAKRKDMGWLYG